MSDDFRGADILTTEKFASRYNQEKIHCAVKHTISHNWPPRKTVKNAQNPNYTLNLNQHVTYL